MLIPIAAIAAGAFREWVKFKSQQRELGGSAAELERAVGALEAELRDQQAAMERRVANLETVITSQTWELLQDGGFSNEDKRFLSDPEMELRTLREELGDARKAELIARHLK